MGLFLGLEGYAHEDKIRCCFLAWMLMYYACCSVFKPMDKLIGLRKFPNDATTLSVPNFHTISVGGFYI